MQANEHRRNIHFNESDLVHVKIHTYRLHSLAKRINKLISRYFEPFEIAQRIGPVAYCLELPPTATIHPVFHVSQLKKKKFTWGYWDLYTTATTPWCHIRVDGKLEQVLKSMKIIKWATWMLIQWKGLLFSQASWEISEAFQHHFPSFNLEDKVSLESRLLISLQSSYQRFKKIGEGDDSNKFC